MGAYNSCTVYCDDKSRRKNKGDGPYSYNCVKERVVSKKGNKADAFTHCVNMCKICGDHKKCVGGNNTLLQCTEKGLSRGAAIGLAIGLPLAVQLLLATILCIFLGVRGKRRIIHPDIGRPLRSPHQSPQGLRSPPDGINKYDDPSSHVPHENGAGATNVAEQDETPNVVQDESTTREQAREAQTSPSHHEFARRRVVINEIPCGRMDWKFVLIGAGIITCISLVVITMSIVAIPPLTKYADDPEAAQKYVRKRNL